MTPRRLRPTWPGLERRRQHETRRAEILHLFRHLPDPEGALEATERLVRDHDRRVTESLGWFTEALQGRSERPEVFPQSGRRVGDVAPVSEVPSGSEDVLCRYRWPVEGDTLGRQHVCGLLVHHPGPHQAIGYYASRYDRAGTWHAGGTTVLAEADL
jgi:hypothetical protein